MLLPKRVKRRKLSKKEQRKLEEYKLKLQQESESDEILSSN